MKISLPYFPLEQALLLFCMQTLLHNLGGKKKLLQCINVPIPLFSQTLCNFTTCSKLQISLLGLVSQRARHGDEYSSGP